jgi:hypothetical protein
VLDTQTFVETGRGQGVAIVRKWTDADYARLRTEELKQRALITKFSKARCGGCGKGHDPVIHEMAIADHIALQILRDKGIKPYGVAMGFNAFMRATGNGALWHRLTGIATLPTLYDNTNAKLGVGDSTAAVTVTQTNLQAASNKLAKGMVATYPQISANPNENQVLFRSDFVTGEAEYAWNEFGTFNGALGTGDMFNRGLFSPSPGTKGAGVTWTLTETLTNT